MCDAVAHGNPGAAQRMVSAAGSGHRGGLAPAVPTGGVLSPRAPTAGERGVKGAGDTHPGGWQAGDH